MAWQVEVNTPFPPQSTPGLIFDEDIDARWGFGYETYPSAFISVAVWLFNQTGWIYNQDEVAAFNEDYLRDFQRGLRLYEQRKPKQQKG